MLRHIGIVLLDWAVTFGVAVAGYYMFGHGAAAWFVIAAVLSGSTARTIVERQIEKRDRRRDERAQLIALGASYGVEHVPGESTDYFRRLVAIERDKRTEVERRRWIEAERDQEDERRRKAFEKGRLI